ncbi:MAG TPA: hypothetical protein VFQ61_00795, partial [Polyangiaceae bacterium]|nr:hypothetical protein [Polyangiaceae bacterium]
MRHDAGFIWRTFGLVSCASTLSLAACSGDSTSGGTAGTGTVAPGSSGANAGGNAGSGAGGNASGGASAP